MNAGPKSRSTRLTVVSDKRLFKPYTKMRWYIIAPVMATLVVVMGQYIECVIQDYLYRNQKINVDTNKVHVFETKSGLSTDECVEECKLRKACSFINYHRYAQVCYMLKADSYSTIIDAADSKGFIYAKKSDWNMTYHDKRCSNCNDTETCQLSNNATTRCITTGCGRPPAVDDAIILGNRYVIGSVIKYKCRRENRIKISSQSQIICQDNGIWTKPQIQCVYRCNWKWNENSCYWIEDTLKTWKEATENCKHFDANLVDIGTTEEAEFLNKIIAFSSSSGLRVYIGLNDISEEGVFLWLDGTEPELNNWKKGQPNDKDEDCVMIKDKEWHDISCSTPLTSICEYELNGHNYP